MLSIIICDNTKIKYKETTKVKDLIRTLIFITKNALGFTANRKTLKCSRLHPSNPY